MYSIRKENRTIKHAILHVRGLYGLDEVLQFVSVQDLVHFFTLHTFDIGVKLRPMNVTDHLKQKKQEKMDAPEVHSDSKVSEVHILLYIMQYTTVVWYSQTVHFSGHWSTGLAVN